MNTENFAFLSENIKYLGFESKLMQTERLAEQIEKGVKEFQLDAEAFFDDCTRLEAVLHFRKSDQSDLYFFNKYEVRLTNTEDPDQDKAQTFYINKGTGVTCKEAFNLLQGRYVYKELTNQEGQKYNAWIQLNFEEKDHNNNYKYRHYTEKYGYDLEKTLERYPIKELHPEGNRALLIRSLQRGNLQPVTFERNGRAEKMFIEANARYKTINLYNNSLKRTRREALKVNTPGDTADAQSQQQSEAVEETETARTKKEEETVGSRIRPRIRRV
ncbi:MAG: hypothetical protein P4L51_29055 [Puia sp.]|nr:hypothetical protein [Puia sp.]